LPINQNQALFSLLGTTYGGNGQTNFQLPNLQGRVPIHLGGGFAEGQAAGEVSHTLTISELPAHTHQLNGSATNADVISPGGNLLAQSSLLYGPPAQLTTLDPSSVGNGGGSQAHLNMQPYLVLNFCICLQGIFPSRN
jgi:microcystin-dependent protein